MAPDESPGRILGIGGIFFKSPDHKALRSWYLDKLGLANESMFKWRNHAQPETEHMTVWSIFPAASEYFERPTMINYIVDDMDAFLAKCSAKSIKIDPKRDDHDYGRFAWIYDLDGNKIELWEPKG